MWSLLLLLFYIAATDRVASQGDRLILKGGNNPCEGYIEIFHGDWGIVGDNNWNPNNEDVVCRSIGCGQAERQDAYKMTSEIPNIPKKVWINEVNCSGIEPQLWKCPNFRGWGVSVYNQDTVKWIKCSGKIEMSLDGFRCAGAVQFNSTTDGRHSQQYVCSDNFKKAQADLVCKNLNCGDAKELPDPTKTTSPEGFKSKPKKKITCTPTNKEDHLWQCDPQPAASCSKPAFVTCKDHPILRLEGGDNACSGNLTMTDGDIKTVTCNENTKISPDIMCEQLRCGTNATQNSFNCGRSPSVLPTLTCSEKITVTLMDPGPRKTSYCYGAVYVNSSMGQKPVCGTDWDKEDGQVVCKELGCGKVIYTNDPRTTEQKNGILDNVNCDGTENKLWHCKAKYNDAGACRNNAFVTCEKSIDVRLSDGPGKCAGIVEIQHDGEWKMVAHSIKWTIDNSNSVCNELSCGDSKSFGKSTLSLKTDSYFEKTVSCKKLQKLSDCVNDEPLRVGNPKKPVEIICQKHKVVFMRNGKSCSGQVGVEHDEKDYWLSGSNETWNHTADVVCRQLHCGKAISHRLLPFPSGDPGMENVPWEESYNCLSTEASVFDCPKDNTAPSNQSIAFVECSGIITATLTEKCWGTVKVSINGTDGGVCADTWTPDHSEMLCKDLECGHAFPDIKQTGGDLEVSILAMHQTKQTTKLTESIIVKQVRKTNCDNTAYVVCSASVKADFSDSRDHCSGNVKILYRGERHPVCKDTLNEDVQKTICSELQCGETHGTLEFFGPLPSSKGVSALTCPAGKSSMLANCTIGQQGTTRCALGGLKCSDWRKITLKKPKEISACQGDVIVYSDQSTRLVSSQDWTKEEGEKLCHDLRLGGYKNHTESNRMTGKIDSRMWGKTFNCSDAEKPRTIWDCESERAPSKNEGVYLQCKDNPEVTLSKKCAGELKINGKRVCNNNWNDTYSQIVCQELGCSAAVPFKEQGTELKRDVYHVHCEGFESNLGLCETAIGNCDGALVSVYCTGGIQFKTTEFCGGRIQVRYEETGNWENVCPPNLQDFGKTFKNLLCKELKCGEVMDYSVKDTASQTMKTALVCKDNYMFIKDCVEKKTCPPSNPATIYCTGFLIPTTTTTVTPTTISIATTTTAQAPVALITGVSLGAVGMIMIMLLLLCLFLRRRIFKLRKSPQKDHEYESGEYEDVDINHEMKALNRFGSRSEAAAVKQNDAGSNSSLSYDDIDEQEVTSGAAGPSSHNPQHDYINTQREDTVTYEVEDPLEAYDDVDTVPDIRVTPAEVHAVPRPGEHLDQLMGDEDQDKDYLEPDKEG